MRNSWFGLFLTIAFGCSSPSSLREATPETEPLSSAKVMEIAKEAVAANDTWGDRAEYGMPTQQEDGSWSVLVVRIPKTPGGHRIIEIDTNRNVTNYVRGR
jgi:hypothetical protein